MHTRKKVLILGHSQAAYRTAMVSARLMNLSGQFIVLALDPAYFKHSFGLLNKIVSGVLFGISGSLAVLRADIIYVTAMSHTHSTCYFLARLAKVLKKRLIFDFYISFYETHVIDKKIDLPDSKRAQTFKKRDIFAIQNGDPVIFLNKTEQAYYTSALSIRAKDESSAFLPLFVPIRRMSRLPALRQQDGQSNEPLVITWWGRLGNPIHGIDLILEAAELLKKGGMNFRIWLFPAGKEHEITELRENVRTRSLDEHLTVDNHKTFGNGELESFLLLSADIALGQFGSTQKAVNVFPNKILDAMSLGIPCITARSTAMTELLNENEIIYIQERTADSLADAIRQTLNNKQATVSIAENGYLALQSKFSQQAFDNKLSSIFSQNANS